MTTDDLQYYATPIEAVEPMRSVFSGYSKVFDPCCGAGHLLSALRTMGAREVSGFEIDPERAMLARMFGNITQCNALDTPWPNLPTIINPPFKGKSWWPWAERAREQEDAWLLLPGSVLNASSHLSRLDGSVMCPLLRRPKFVGQDNVFKFYTGIWFGLGKNQLRHDGLTWRIAR
jgi:hypothetical protein